jgi:anaerobic magnesium-protoporphyrin IX monomethyl ester cyclase
MIDIVLTSGFFYGTIKIAEPMGICFLAAELRKEGFSVEIVEPSIEGWTVSETAERLLKIPCKMLGISLQLDDNVSSATELINLLRNNDYKPFICVGGHAPSIGVKNERNIYKELARIINCYIVGEGERSIVQLAKAVITNSDWRNIPGVAYIENDNSFKFNPPAAKIKNLDEVPFMARDVLESYIRKYSKNLPASILFSRGCAYSRCTYCTVGAFEKLQRGACYRQRSIKNVIEEIKFLHLKYGITEFNFEDDNFILPGPEGIKRIELFCHEVSKLDFKIRFTFFCRADAVEYNLFAKLRNVGLSGIYLGIESFSEGTLRFFDKGLTQQHMVNALDTLLSLGYSTEVGSDNRILVGYIIWHPMTTLDELKQSSKFIQKYRMPPKLLRRKLALYTGSSLWNDFEKKGLIDSSSQYGWNYIIPIMKTLEELICTFIGDVSKIRDSIRTIEKAVKQFRIELSIIDMGTWRKELDNMCFTYFDEIIRIAEENKHDSIHKDLYDYDKCMRQRLSYYIGDKKVMENVKKAFEVLNLSEQAIDAFRK